jgi:hypothetical protein
MIIFTQILLTSNQSKPLLPLCCKCVVVIGFINQGGYNKSMERRRKQRLCYQRNFLNLSLRVAGFRLAHLNRSTASLETETNLI